MNPKEMAGVTSENAELRKKYAQLLEQEKQIKRLTNKKKIKPYQYRNLHKRPDEFKEVSSKIDHDLLVAERKKRWEEAADIRTKKETEGCTFAPELNENSKSMKNQGYVPIYQKELPGKKDLAPPPTPEEKEFDAIQEELKKKRPQGLKVNAEEFYKKQTEWEKEKQNKTNKIRLDKALKEYNIKRKPKVNRKKNEKILKKNEDFFKRMEKHQDNIKRKREDMNNRLYTFTFKPKLNENNNVESIVAKDPLGNTATQEIEGN